MTTSSPPNKSTTSNPRKVATAVAIACGLAMPAEGLRNWAYKDPVGIPTICFGTTTGVKLGDYKTTQECRDLLTKDMYAAVQTVDSCRPGLPTPVLAAFADATYNIGPTVACNISRSTAARYLAAGDYAAACRELPKWNKARVGGALVELPGLTKRRQAEMELCLS